MAVVGVGAATPIDAYIDGQHFYSDDAGTAGVAAQVLHCHPSASSQADTVTSPPANADTDVADDGGYAARAVGGPEQRPALTPQMSGVELRRWYWLRSELADLARRVGVSAAGSKAELTDRLAAALDGHPLPPTAPRRPAAAGQLDGVLSMNTVIPVGQRCSQVLRAFFTEHIGAAFTFDAAMRGFIADHAGSTLGDAVTHWHATRSAGPRPIDAQFELNRFTRQWYLEHPGGIRSDLQQAWTAYRNTPTDLRPKV